MERAHLWAMVCVSNRTGLRGHFRQKFKNNHLNRFLDNIKACFVFDQNIGYFQTL